MPPTTDPGADARPAPLPPPSFEAKIVAPEHAAEAARRLPRPLVFTNGVFDLLHRGHVTYLARARALGAGLVVALNSDASVRRLGKGDDRPINPCEDRAAVIASLGCVDLVTWFDDDTPLALIERLVPGVLVKGGDWPVERIVGGDVVRRAGGRVVSIAFEHERSTTRMLARIRGEAGGA
jgi:rfaE bifunctional protein nucleotidyltransferase chain/domain